MVFTSNAFLTSTRYHLCRLKRPEFSLDYKKTEFLEVIQESFCKIEMAKYNLAYRKKVGVDESPTLHKSHD